MSHITLFKHKDGRSPNYYCLYEHPISGNQAAFSCRTSDIDEAREYASRKLPKILGKVIERHHVGRSDHHGPSPLRSTTRTVRTPILLSAFMEQHLSEHRTKNGQPLRPKSREALKDSFNQFIKRLGDKDLHLVTQEECDRFVWTGQPSDRTAEKHWTNLRAAFSAALHAELIDKNPFEGVKRPRPIYSDEEIEARCFSEEDFQLLIENLPVKTFSNRRLRNMLMIAHETGLRLGELRHVKHLWYDLERKVIRVKSDRTFMTKTRSSTRTIGLSDNALDAIRSQLADNFTHSIEEVRQSPYLFPNLRGGVLCENSVELPYRKQRAKILGDRRPRIHGLRHALVTRLSLEGLSDRMIQDITGHSSVAMVQRYSHMKDRLVEPVREALNRGTRYKLPA